METITETTTSITFEQIEPYLKQYEKDSTVTNGLLFFLIVYLIIKDISKYINSFITGGFV